VSTDEMLVLGRAELQSLGLAMLGALCYGRAVELGVGRRIAFP
jgi:hypothetical protein